MSEKLVLTSSITSFGNLSKFLRRTLSLNIPVKALDISPSIPFPVLVTPANFFISGIVLKKTGLPLFCFNELFK